MSQKCVPACVKTGPLVRQSVRGGTTYASAVVLFRWHGVVPGDSAQFGFVKGYGYVFCVPQTEHKLATDGVFVSKQFSSYVFNDENVHWSVCS